jgi:hypothetical protein
MRTTPTLTVIAEGLRFPEGPIAMPDGSLLVVEIAAGCLSRITPAGAREVVAQLGGGPNGAAIAVAAGERALIWTMPVPSWIRSVWAPHQASGVSASLPYASAVQAELYPSRSASLIDSSAPDGGPLPQYPVVYPSFSSFAIAAR